MMMNDIKLHSGIWTIIILSTLLAACGSPPTPTAAPCDTISDFFWAPRDLAIAQDGHLWAVGDDGAWRLDPASGTCALFTEENGLAEDWLAAVAVDLNGDVWLGGWWRGDISHFDGRRWTTYTDYDGWDERGNTVVGIAVAPDNTLWFGFPRYAYHFDGKGWTLYTSDDGLPRLGVTAIAAAPDGTVWFGAVESLGGTGGIARFDGEEWVSYTTDDGLANNDINAIAVAPDNTVWVGTDGGVSRFDGRRWTTYTEEDGLVHDHIMDIAIGPEGTVWFATSEGIARFDGEHWTAYTERDGLLSNFVPAIAVAPDGKVWAGMDGGLASFDGQHWTVHKVGRDIPPPSPTATPPAATPAPAEPTAPSVAAPTPLEWPADVGTSHFGRLVGGRERVDFAGAWIRPHPGPFIWGQVEVRPGTYNWEQPDRLVAGAQEQRLAILATVWPFAQWDQETCHADQPRAEGAFPELGDLLYSPCDPAAYAAWLTALVERYDGDGVGDMPGLAYPIRHWEISNEPEMQQPQLTFFQEGPGAYLEILRLSYETVKAADPNAVVLTAGQAGMQPQSVTYWRPILEGADGLFDLGNVHSIGSSDVFFAPEYRAWLDELGYTDKGYWITEALVGRMGPPGRPQPDEDELAQLTLVSYAAAFGYGAEVVIRVGGHDPSGGPGEASKQTFLLLANTIGDFTAATLLAENAVRFDMPDGRVVYALWDGATLPPEVTGTVKTITYAGEEAQHNAAEIVASVPTLVVMERNYPDHGMKPPSQAGVRSQLCRVTGCE